MNMYMTAGDLKKRLVDVPDDTKVYIQRIEDTYFDTEDGNWSTLDKRLTFDCFVTEHQMEGVSEAMQKEHEEYCKSHYIPAFSGYCHWEDKDVFVINAHY